MASFNRVVLMGNLTRDVEVRYLQSGTAVADITLAVNDRRKSNTGEWIEETSFIDCTLWGRTAEVAGEYLSKGAPALVEGRLKQESWEQEGQKRSKIKVIVEQLRMVGSKGGGGGGGGRTHQVDSAHVDSGHMGDGGGSSPYSEPMPTQSAGSRSGGGVGDDIPF